MPITHHPDEATLMSYAAGSLPEALSAVVAAHEAVCSACPREVALLEDLGLVALERSAPVEIGGLPALPSSLSAEAASHGTCVLERSVLDEDGDVPAPLRHLVGAHSDQIPWKRLGLGLWHYPLPLSDSGKGDLRLLKVAPNRSMPDHGHGGAELTIVLKGSYSDQTGCYARGDVADLDESIEHQPISDAHEGCICLIASERPARFKGFMGRLVQPLAGF
jgi:putative transcriptional regulator